MRLFHLVFALFFLALVFIFSCKRDTKTFGKLKVNGRLINYITKQPISQSSVFLNYETKERDTKYKFPVLAATTTDDDGNFVFESKIARTNKYKINYSPYDKLLIDTSFSLSSSHQLNLGTMNYGEYNFSIQFHLIPTSGNCIFIDLPSFQRIKINAGVDTTISFNKTLTYVEFKNQPYFNLGSSVTNCSIQASSVITVRNTYPLNPSGGVTMINLNY
jgi:hypothetical protein